MKKSELPNCPKWLLDARMENENVEWGLGESYVIWRSGLFLGGEFRGGSWKITEIPDRISYMASMCGIVFDERGWATAYRTTKADGAGRHTHGFVQKSGKYYEKDLPRSGLGTCVKGIHVTTMATAWTYFGIDKTAQMWEVRFRREDLLDCDSQKARIRGGIFRKVKVPWLKQAQAEAEEVGQ